MSLAETMLTARPRRFGLWHSVWKLLRLRVRIAFNSFKHAKTRGKVGTIALWLLALALMVFLYFLSTLLLRFLRSPQLAQFMDPSQFLASIPALILSMAFFLTLITNFGVLLQALYLSRDMDFLITSPLPMRSVFLAKLIEAILPSFALFCAFTLPVLFGLGSSSGYNLLYYPLLLLMMALLALAAGGIAAVLVMSVVRLVPAKRVAEVLGFVGAMFSVLIGQSGQLVRFVDPDSANVTQTLTTLSSLTPDWSPFTWAGRGLVSVGQGEWAVGLGLSALALLLAGGVFGGMLQLSEYLYYTGWSSMQGTARRKKQREPRAAVREERGPLSKLIPRPMRGLLAKDFLLLRRDPRNYANLLTPLIVGFVLLFTTQGGGRRTEAMFTNLGLRDLESYGIAVLAIFVGWMVMINLGTLAFTREGRNYWMLKTAPIKPMHLLWSKFLVAYLPSLGFSLLYLVLANLIRGANWATLPYNMLLLASAIAGACGIAVAFGTAGANLEWDSPQKQHLRGAAGCVSVLALGGFLLLDLALFFAPLGAWQLLSGSIPPLAFITGALLGIVAAVLAVLLPLLAVKDRVACIGEVD